MSQRTPSQAGLCLRCLLRAAAPGTRRHISQQARTLSNRQAQTSSVTLQHRQSQRTLHSTSPHQRPPRPETHYDFFPTTLPRGPPPNGPFSIDLPALRREFLQIQSSAHPDRHSGSQKARAEALSARVNDAYKTLQDPLSRAQYVLSLNGVNVAGDEAGTVEDKGLLMRVMEAREMIEEAVDEEELKGLRERNGKDLERSVRVLEGLLERGDWEAARTEAVRLRYWVNIKESIDGWEKGRPVRLHH